MVIEVPKVIQYVQVVMMKCLQQARKKVYLHNQSYLAPLQALTVFQTYQPWREVQLWLLAKKIMTTMWSYF